MTYESAPRRSKRDMVAIMAGKGYAIRQPVLIARNTLDCYIGDCRYILFHNTIILRFGEWGDSFLIDTGGFNTTTTSDRLNRFMGGSWRVSLGGKGPVLYHYLASSKRFLRYAAVTSAGKIISDLD